MKKSLKIFSNTLPIILMISLIPLIANDYILTSLYLVIIIFFLYIIRVSQNEIIIFVFGLIFMTFSEYLFISTGVETFVRNSLFGLMPLWLPLLWAYGFVVISRCVKILEK